MSWPEQEHGNNNSYREQRCGTTPHPAHEASGTDTTEQVAPMIVACQPTRKQQTDTSVGGGFTSTTDKPDTPT
ncbi:hypothetical protein HanIR_Chr08g0364531 [Helianthus annuus]|nr:hypothetical protein HanIR_Chr08g0364531 [Helianthus annuus]